MKASVAQRMVQKAIRTGDLIRPSTCEDCGAAAERIEGHHDDYSKPLDVRWLCRRCHRGLHGRIGKVEKGRDPEDYRVLSVWLTKEQAAALKEQAQRNQRSLSAEIRHILRTHIEQEQGA